MLVQHFLPLSSSTVAVNSSSSPSASSRALLNNKKASVLSPFFDSESTGFQPTTDSLNNCMGYSEKIKTHLSSWPRKLTSVMEIQRQRFSQLNPRFKQQQQRTAAAATAAFVQPVSTSVVCPVILPAASRPQPRQQARSKPQPPQRQQQQTHFLPVPSRRPTTVQGNNRQQQVPPPTSDCQYITLANLTKILHVLQTQVKINDGETSTDTSTSTSNSTKQRVQQHLQETATRWWKPTRSSDCHPTAPAPSTLTYTTSVTPIQQSGSNVARQHFISDENQDPQTTLPLLTIVSDSTRHIHVPSGSGTGHSKYEESESSTEVQATTTVVTSLAQPPQTATTHQQPLIMQARGMRLHSYDYRNYSTNKMNFFQRQRLIRQT